MEWVKGCSKNMAHDIWPGWPGIGLCVSAWVRGKKHNPREDARKSIKLCGVRNEEGEKSN